MAFADEHGSVEPRASAEVGLSEQNREGLHILVVEDNSGIAESLAMLLRFWGHQVRVAANATSALQAAKACLPDVALIDIGLPGIDGYTVARWFGKQACGKRPLLIAVTGLWQEADRRRSAEVGIDLHLVKPVDPDRLCELLRRFQRIIL